MTRDIPDVLQRIIERKREEVAQRKRTRTLASLESELPRLAPVRGFASALQARIAAGDAAVIAEVKKASPSKGVIRADFAPAEIAGQYAAGGATCLSVLTDRDFFQGHEDYLTLARQACALPVLRKDFTVDVYQIAEARRIGADAVLLIAAVLDKAQLEDLSSAAAHYDLDVLVEVHDRAELEIAMDLSTPLLGINNRNLRDFSVSLQTTLSLLPYVPKDKVLVTESAIHQRSDVARMRDAGVSAFLVGEAFMRAADPGAALRELFS